MRSEAKVFVYFNHARKLWSLRAVNGINKGRVIAHCTRVLIRDATFKVSETGRQRVIREGVKNVHAGVIGEVVGAVGCALRDTDLVWTCEDIYERTKARGAMVTYKPRRGPDFMALDRHGETPIRCADVVLLDNRIVHALSEQHS